MGRRADHRLSQLPQAALHRPVVTGTPSWGQQRQRWRTAEAEATDPVAQSGGCLEVVGDALDDADDAEAAAAVRGGT